MESKISFELIKRLVAELEVLTLKAEEIFTATGNKTTYIVELSKSAGLAAQISGEGMALMADLQRLMAGGNTDPLATLKTSLGKIKGVGGTN